MIQPDDVFEPPPPPHDAIDLMQKWMDHGMPEIPMGPGVTLTDLGRWLAAWRYQYQDDPKEQTRKLEIVRVALGI